MLYLSPILFSSVCLELLCPDGDPEAERHVIYWKYHSHWPSSTGRTGRAPVRPAGRGAGAGYACVLPQGSCHGLHFPMGRA